MALPKYLYSGVSYVATAGQSTFALTTEAGKPINYLSPSHIQVRTSANNGGSWTDLTLGADWLFADPPVSVVITGGVEEGNYVDIRRTTPLDDDFIHFEDGNLLTAEQLNTFDSWQLYIDQEIVDSVVTIEANSGPGTTDDLPEGSINLYYTDERVQDVIDSQPPVDVGVTKIVAGANVTISPTSGVGEVRINSTGGGGGGGGMTYKGTIDATQAAPEYPLNGDLYINTGEGTVDASWAGAGGAEVKGNEQLIYDGDESAWTLVDNSGTAGIPEAPDDGSLYARKSLAWESFVIPDVPTKTSELENDSGFITSDDIPTVGGQGLDDVLKIGNTSDLGAEFKGRVDVGATSLDNYALAAFSSSSTNGGIYSQNNNASGKLYVGQENANEVFKVYANGKVEAKGYRIDQLTTLP